VPHTWPQNSPAPLPRLLFGVVVPSRRLVLA
jgi:hypothetical protein